MIHEKQTDILEMQTLSNVQHIRKKLKYIIRYIQKGVPVDYHVKLHIFNYFLSLCLRV